MSTLFWDWSDVAAKIIAVLALVGFAFIASIVLALIGGYICIWALNQLFGLGMQYSFHNVLAMAAIIFFLKGGVTITTKKD